MNLEPVWGMAIEEPIVSLFEYWHDDGPHRIWHSYVVMPSTHPYLFFRRGDAETLQKRCVHGVPDNEVCGYCCGYAEQAGSK